MTIKTKLIPMILSAVLLTAGVTSIGISTKYAVEVSAINYDAYEAQSNASDRGSWATSISVGDVVTINALSVNKTFTGINSDDRGTPGEFTNAPTNGIRFKVVTGNNNSNFAFQREDNTYLTYTYKLDTSGGFKFQGTLNVKAVSIIFVSIYIKITFIYGRIHYQIRLRILDFIRLHLQVMQPNKHQSLLTMQWQN